MKKTIFLFLFSMIYSLAFCQTETIRNSVINNGYEYRVLYSINVSQRKGSSWDWVAPATAAVWKKKDDASTKFTLVKSGIKMTYHCPNSNKSAADQALKVINENTAIKIQTK